MENKIGDDTFLRVGKLHVVFAMCHAIGKYIDSSGLYKPFTHCGIYGHLDIQMFLEGKNVKICIYAFSISVFIFLDIWTASKNVLQNWTINERNYSRYLSTTTHELADRHEQIINFWLKDLKQSGSMIDSVAFVPTWKNVVRMIANLLLYVRATKQKL